MATKIVTKNSSTAGSAPSASDLVQGELAVNVVDKRLYTEDNAGNIVELGTNPSTIDINGGTIDGTVIGGTTTAAISGTTGQFSTSLNVDGTATMDGLTVDGTGGSSSVVTVSGNDQANVRLTLDNNGAGGNEWELVGGLHGANNSALTVYDKTNTAKRAAFANNGDISFYEPTGTTAKFFWDASAEKLNLTGTGGIDVTGTITSTAFGSQLANTLFEQNVLKSSVASSAGAFIRMAVSANSNPTYAFEDDTNTGMFTSGADTLNFTTGGLERMRIDSSGNVLVGKSSNAIATAGAKLGTGGSNFTRSGNVVTSFNRTGSDGTISEWMKDGTTVGSISTLSGNLTIGSGNAGLRFNPPFGEVLPHNVTNNSGTDGTVTLGSNGVRFKDLHLSGKVYTPDVRSIGIQYFTHTTDARFRTSTGAERMRIDSSGSLSFGGIATPTPQTDSLVIYQSDNYALYSGSNGTGGSNHMVFGNANSWVGSISTNGSSTSYNTSSDYRLKEDWKPIENATETFMQLKPCNFAWKADGSRVDGFLAHELQEVIPSAATGEKDGMRTEEYKVTAAVYEDVVIPAVEAVEAEYDEDGNVVVEAIEAQDERTEQQLVSDAVMGEREVPDMQGIDQSKLVPLLVAALQEAITKIESLEARLSALEA